MKKYTFLLLVVLILLFGTSLGQKETQPLKAETGTLTFLGISQPIQSLETFPFPEYQKFERNEEMKNRLYPFAESALPKGPDPVVQKYMGVNNDSKGLTINYDGMSNTGYPPDPNGDVGPNHYFQTINTQYQIFDKAGNSLYGPADIRNFWGTTEGVSDPVVLYDDNADRWFVEIFTTTPVGSYNVMMAISLTPDPLGAFYLYTLGGLPNLPDFTKYGVWRDGYYMSANSGSFDVYAFDRSALLAGAPTGYVRFDNAWRPNSGFHCIMPLDNDGAFAPAGTPGQFITINDDAWGGNDELWIYELDVDWTNTSTATFTRTQQITVASFDSNFGPSWDNIYQQGTTQRLDAVPQVLNYRVQYRNFGTHQTIVCNHSVDIDNTDHAGVRWYELRDTGGSWWLYQQSTYAPDAHSRWMGAIAMNAYGDIGLAYSTSSSSLYPGLRYTGRHESDPLGTMTFADQSIWDGAYSQTYGNRWGDYYSMSVDPSDNRTFWFTGEYHGSGYDRRTRIAAINFGVYCAASGGCDEYISDVFFGSINNSSGCTNYGDYTAMQTDLPLNGAEFLTIHNGNPSYTVDECGVWIDWNSDGDFVDANEPITMTGSPGVGPYTTTITPPTGTTTGLKTMRIRIDYYTIPLPCGTATWGEVEDYTINVTPKVPAVWTGAFDENWHNADNWSTPIIPDATTDVIIPATTTKCWVWAGPAQCKNITIEFGSGNDLRIWDQDLEVYGDMDFYGQLLMDHADGRIIATENVTWHAGSRASIQANSIFEVYGDWNFQSGANVTMNNGLVGFTGAGTSMIRSYEENCYFNHVVIYKSSPGWASISNLSTVDIHIHGDLAIEPGSNMYCYTPESVLLQGNLVCLGSFMAYDGTMTFDGADQLIFWNGTVSDNLFFNNLTISSAISTSIINYLVQNIAINANMIIEEGQLITNGYPLRVGGNWDNQVGPGGFVADTSRVIFDGGNYHQYCSDEYFHILEVDKPLGGAFRMEGTHVECAAYDWTAGAIDVIPGGGSFTAFDLVDDAIYGAYYLNPGGTINLYQDTDPLSYTDINGELHIFGGIMNVYGGIGPSYWSFAGDAFISMSDGVLDFHDQGIYAWESGTHTLTENITGGTIRTLYGFWANSPTFTPDGGTIELYSTNDADIFTINGSNLYNVLINKVPKKEKTSKPKGVSNNIQLIDERSGKTISDGSKSNTISLYDFLDINGNLVIESGVLNTDGYNIQIEGDWTNYVGDAGFIESTGWVVFDGNSKVANLHTDETYNNLMLANTTNGIFGLTLMDGINVNVNNDLDLQWSTLEMNPNSELHVGGNIFIAYGAGLNADDGYNQISIGGHWTDENDPNTNYFGFWPGGEVVTFDGATDQILNTNGPQEDFTNVVINKPSGSFRPNDNIQIYGGLQILDGDWSDYAPSLTHYWNWHVLIDANGNYYPQGTTVFSGTVDQTYENNGGTAMFRDVIIDKSGALILNSDMVVFNGHTTSVNSGILNLNGHWFKGTGDININNGGEILVDAGAYLSIVENLYVNSGGLFTAAGTEVNNATIFIDVVGNYGFEVNANGTISANYATFYGMDQNGIWVEYGAFVDTDNAFNNCTFGIGENGLGAARLTINNDQLLYLDNIKIIDNPFIPGSFNVQKDLDYGELIISNYEGNFSGPDYEDDPHNRIHWYPSEYRLELKVFMEGPFSGTYMSPELNSILPLNHPFNPALPYFGNPFPDWYYNISGTVPFIPDIAVVDWVLVELRDASSPSAALPVTAIATTPAFILEDGSIIALDGSNQLTFEVTPINDLYVVIWHRNHLGVISANPLTEIGGTYQYDFSTSASQAFGGLSAQIQLSASPAIWGMMAGDGDGNGVVEDLDKLNIWNIQTGTEGYLESDYNLNKNVNNLDKNDFWFKNNGKATYIPE